MSERRVNRFCRQGIGVWFSIIATIILIGMNMAQEALSDHLPDEAKSALLKGDWSGVLAVLERSGIKEAEGVCGFVMAQAYLATNRAGKSAELFAVLDAEDVSKWLEWTKEIALGQPNNAVAHYLYADALARSGQLDEALQSLGRSLEADERFGMAYVMRGIVRTIRGVGAKDKDWEDDAYQDLSIGVQLMPQSSYAHAGFGFYYLATKTPEEAVRGYIKALELDPSFGEAMVGLACAELAQGNFEEAFADLEAVTALVPALEEICIRDRDQMLAVVNGFLHEISKYIEGIEPGTTLKSEFQVSEQIIEGNVVPVYILQPSVNYEDTLRMVRSAMQDLSERTGKPIPDLKVHVHAHGWGGSGFAHKEFAGRMAILGGKDAVIALDLPELRGNMSPEAGGRLGKVVSAFKWRDVSDIGGIKVAQTGRALNETLSSTPSFSGHSGGAEVFVKQDRLKGEKLPSWDQVILIAYPFSDMPFVPVRVPDEVAKNTERITVLRTSFGNWSNKLTGPTDKVVNLVLEQDGRGIPHGSWKEEKIYGERNPVFPVANLALNGAPTEQIKSFIDNTLTRTEPWQSRKGNVTEIIEPFLGFGPRSRALDGLPSLGEFSYVPLPSKELEIRAPSQPEVIYDRIVRPFPHSAVVDAIDTGIGIVGAVAGAKVPATMGELDKRSLKEYMLDNTYVGAWRLRVWQERDENFIGIYRFDPKHDPAGRLLSNDPLAPENWRLLPKDRALEQLHSNLSTQSFSNGGVDPTVKQLFDRISPVKWQDHLKLLQPLEFGALLKSYQQNPDREVTVTLPGRPTINTTVGAFLKGEIPLTRQEDVFAAEFEQTSWFRRTYGGQGIGFRDWLDSDSVAVAPEITSGLSGWQNIGATSFGKEPRLADVWHKEFWSGTNTDKMILDASALAKSRGITDVTLVHTGSPEGYASFNGLKQGLEQRGLRVHEVIDGRQSKVTLVASGMGGAMSTQNKQWIVISVKDSYGYPRIKGEPLDDMEGPEGVRLLPPSHLPPSPSLPSPRLLIQDGDHDKDHHDKDYIKIAGLARSLGSPAVGQVGIIGTGDFRSDLTALQMNDRGYDVMKVPPSALPKRLEGIPLIAVQPRAPSVSTVGNLISPKTEERLVPPTITRPQYDWNLIEPALRNQGFQNFNLPKPPSLPGGVSMKEFAHAWVDKGDWPLWLPVPGWYAEPISLMR